LVAQTDTKPYISLPIVGGRFLGIPGITRTVCGQPTVELLGRRECGGLTEVWIEQHEEEGGHLALSTAQERPL
jgi:hypothetical protein